MRQAYPRLSWTAVKTYINRFASQTIMPFVLAHNFSLSSVI